MKTNVDLTLHNDFSSSPHTLQHIDKLLGRTYPWDPPAGERYIAQREERLLTQVIMYGGPQELLLGTGTTRQRMRRWLLAQVYECEVCGVALSPLPWVRRGHTCCDACWARLMDADTGRFPWAPPTSPPEGVAQRLAPLFPEEEEQPRFTTVNAHVRVTARVRAGGRTGWHVLKALLRALA